ncbi:MAG: hypothetical protein COT85_07805 [Chlamydiae bacterium CG10_big_fil_rev_8_21_14_0_10_42_34]|nr:MAG: hypothetical protein COT85_07805 [Chlamydiae bacterium CG10_big_fil_rev_8_21_14_0_10_42_34]
MKYFLLLLPLLSLFAQDEEAEFDPKISITNHQIKTHNGVLNYTAMTGVCPILYNNTIEAELFFISYTKDSEEDRPITFVFPGGPGGAGTLESIITFGPRRILTAGEGRTIHPPYKLIDNPETILEYTDLVFVDPAECGYSKITENGNPDFFFSVEGDIQSLGEFIHNFIDSTCRWNSPIYLSGGSYGTMRCAGLAANLFQYGIAVRGIILEGCAFAFDTIVSARDQILPNCLMIPTFAATAWHHGRLWPEKSLEEVVDYARRFAFDEYAPHMLQPTRLSYVEKTVFEEKMADLIGLSTDTIKRFNGKIDETIYTSHFFGSERKVLGGLDTRYSSDIATIDPQHAGDPSYLDSIGIRPAFIHYLQNELDTFFDYQKYVGFSMQAITSWNFSSYDTWGKPNLLQRLRHTLIANPQMKVFIGSGYYDCRTPFAATEYCFDHLDLPASYQSNLQFEYYKAGHGFIFDYPSLKKLKRDLTKFYGIKTTN